MINTSLNPILPQPVLIVIVRRHYGIEIWQKLLDFCTAFCLPVIATTNWSGEKKYWSIGRVYFAKSLGKNNSHLPILSDLFCSFIIGPLFLSQSRRSCNVHQWCV